MESYEFANIYAEKKLKETEGCSTLYRLKDSLSSVFIYVSVYNPELFKDLLKYLKIDASQGETCQL